MEERKSSKKTRGIIIVAMLLLLVAIGCLCGITFAKYITEKSVPAQTATVAKWGFVINADTSKLFGKDYVKESGDNATVATADGVAVKASAAAVAPGTQGEMIFSVIGNAEVPAKITITAGSDIKEVKLTGSGEGALNYAPVKWTIASSSDGTTYTPITTVGSGDATVTADGTLAKALEIANKQSTEIAASTTETKMYFKLSWVWALTTSDVTNADRYDTLLGYAADCGTTASKEYTDATVTVAGDTSTVLDKLTISDTNTTGTSYTAETKIEFSLTIKVEQIQTLTPAA